MLNLTAIKYIHCYLCTFRRLYRHWKWIRKFCLLHTQNLLQKRPFFLLINLAVLDLLVGIADPIVPFSVKVPLMDMQAEMIKNPPPALKLLASFTSVFFLALISQERVYVVKWPLRHRASNTIECTFTASSLPGLLGCSRVDCLCYRCITQTWTGDILLQLSIAAFLFLYWLFVQVI